MGLGVEFAKKFIKGELKPFNKPIEDSEHFALLSTTHSERNASIESAVMELAHGSCHILTVALSDALDLNSALVIRDTSGMPIHSGLHNSKLGLILDANGVHKIEDALKFWGSLAKKECYAAQIDVDDLYSLCSFDEDDAQMALDDFDLIADFIESEIIGKRPPRSTYTMGMG